MLADNFKMIMNTLIIAICKITTVFLQAMKPHVMTVLTS